MFDANVERIDLPIDTLAQVEVFNRRMDNTDLGSARNAAKGLFLTMKIKERLHQDENELVSFQIDQIREFQAEIARQKLAIASLKAAIDEQTKALADRAETIAALEQQITCLQSQNEELKRGGDRERA